MKNKRKNIFSNGDEEINANDIISARESYVKSILESMATHGIPDVGPNISTANISEAIQGKSVVKDEENDRILGITDDAVIEFDENIIKGVTIATQNILKKFKERVENGSVIYPNVMETLTYIEFSNAAFIETPEFIEVKHELNEILRGMLNCDNPEYIEAAREGILGFFQASKDNIIRGKKHFKVGYSLQNSDEKEFLRALFIAEMVEDGVIDYDFLEMAGEIDELDFELIDCLYKKSELFTPEQIAKALLASECFQTREEILDFYVKKDKRYFVNLATSEEIARYIIAGQITPRDANKKIRIEDVKKFSPELLEEFLCVNNFPKGTEFIDYTQNGAKREKALSPKLLAKLDRERFLKIVLSEKISASYKNPYQSNDYINEFGKLNTEDMMYLHEAGKINSEDLIKLINFKSMKVQEPEEYDKMVETLLAFYNLDTVESLIKEEKTNPKFVELYNKLLTEVASEEQRKTYFERMNQDLQERENSEETVSSLVVSGLNVGKDIEFEISEDYIAEEFLEDRIKENDLLKMYEDGLISLKAIRMLYSDPDIIERYKAGKLDYKVLNILENRADIIKEEVKSKRLSIPNLMALYSKEDGIQIDEFSDIVDEIDLGDDSLTDYLLDEISPDKVKALFNRYFISHDDLSLLVARNIIDAKQAEEFAEQMATNEQYESIFNLDKRIIRLTSETEGGFGGNGGHRVGPGPKRPGQIKNDPELQELLLSQIGFDERTLILEGTNNSLDGYKVFPSREYKVMVFLKNDKPGNATYIMSLQQGLFFLNKIVRERRAQSGEIILAEELQSDATKQALRETEFVKVRNASAGWGANIVDAMKKLSPQFRSKLRGKSEYKKSIDEVIEEIREDYKERKERD